jgi:predicted ribosomally synthesized peptide with SipW-like signal peptide
MKGKNKKKRALKISLIAMSFVLVMVLGVSLTLAWFYDGDWASNYVQMGGPVGITITDSAGTTSSGANKLHFQLGAGTQAYPGQSVSIQAGVKNNGEQKQVIVRDTDGNAKVETQTVGSSCYIRAHFAVYTNMPADDGFNTSELCKFVDGLIGTQNKLFTGVVSGGAFTTEPTMDYYWFYYQNQGVKALSTTGTGVGANGNPDVKYYIDGTGHEITSEQAATDTYAKKLDLGYYYLCGMKPSITTETYTGYTNAEKIAARTIPSGTNAADSAYLKELKFNETAAYLWNSTIVIPWSLTNASANSYMIVEVIFQAVQSYIPTISSAGVISSASDNQVKEPTVSNSSVQTLFSSCNFITVTEADTKIVDNRGTTDDASDDITIKYKNTDGTAYRLADDESTADIDESADDYPLNFTKATKASVATGS